MKRKKSNKSQIMLDIWVHLTRFYSGMLNASMLLSVGTMLTLHTGNLTKIGMNIVQQEWSLILAPLTAIISYLVGAFIANSYFGEKTKVMHHDYWHGYLLISIIFIILWILPIDSKSFYIILSLSMGILCSMSLPNRGYTGTITMMTGLMTEMMRLLSNWIFRKSSKDKKKFAYLTISFLAYVLGIVIQTFYYLAVGIARAWPLSLISAILAILSYFYGLNLQSEYKK